MEYATSFARNHPEGARSCENFYFHGNEAVYAMRNNPRKCTAYCLECEWERNFTDLEQDDYGYFVVPPLCPDCWKDDTVSGVRSKSSEQRAVVTDTPESRFE